MGKEQAEFDVIILGGGPGGLSAAMWCAELGLRSIVLEKSANLGGQLNWIHTPILNYPGIETANGPDFLARLINQLAKRKYEKKTGAEIIAIDLSNRSVSLVDGSVMRSRAIIIATGVRRRTLGVEGERDFVGRGILETGQINRDRLKGKRLLIVGGGDAAFENAAKLSEYADRIFLLHRRAVFSARKEFVDRVLHDPRIEIITDARVEKLTGSDRLERVDYVNANNGNLRTISVDAMLIRIGVTPNTQLFRKAANFDTNSVTDNPPIALDRNGYVLVDAAGKTSVPHVYAIGDVAHPESPTISTASGTAATATKSILADLRHRR